MKAIILAGGTGSRLWPLSREMYPKQLINFYGNQSLLQNTVGRLKELVESTDIVTVTNTQYAEAIRAQLAQTNGAVFVMEEPVVKNTAPAIAGALAYFLLNQVDPEEIVIILPSDHLIKDHAAFIETIKEALPLAQAGFLVTLGINPRYPETGYGYIQTGAPISSGFKVLKFIEKPNYEKALQYFNEGGYYWNSGIFIGKIAVLQQELLAYAPEISAQIKKINTISGIIDPFLYETMPNISFDYAVMEKSKKAALVMLKSDWDDLGSWQAIYDIHPKDATNNVLKGNVLAQDVQDSLLYSTDKLLTAVGVKNLVVIATSDAIMVCPKDQSQQVKKIVDHLKERRDSTIISQLTKVKAWGSIRLLLRGTGFTLKEITIQAQVKLPFFRHSDRSERFEVLQGTGVIVTDEKEIYLSAGDFFEIAPGVEYSLQNLFNEPVKILEIQRPERLTAGGLGTSKENMVDI